MTVRLSPRLVELTYEAVLKSFWRRRALSSFLRSSYVSENFLSAWTDDESKRELLDRLFPKLQASDKGKKLLLQMAQNLSEQTTFPDLRGWENADIKIQEAHKAVTELKSYLKVKSDEIKTEKDKKDLRQQASKVKEEVCRSNADRAKLQSKFESMHPRLGTQKGGYEFEEWFYELLDFYEIQNKRPYKANGRQIDGSVTIEGTTYLVELKFTKSQSGATDIDSLKAKVNRMADNTMGIMVSISGYSSVAIDEASGSKSTLLILDTAHLYLLFMGTMNFKEIVTRVRRHASQTGDAYLPANKFSG